MITANRKAGMEKQEAIEKAVDQAIKENLLEGFFKINRAEVIGMCLTEYDEEEFKRVCREDGYTDGLTEGRSEKAVEDALLLIKDYKADPKTAAEKMGAPLEKVLAALQIK